MVWGVILMKLIGTFLVWDIFPVKIGYALTGTYKDGQPLSYQKDIRQRSIYISFLCHGETIQKRIINIDIGFSRPSNDRLLENGINCAIIVEAEDDFNSLITYLLHSTPITCVIYE
jgi:hypothetical protein